MSFRSKADRIRSNRNGQLAQSQRVGPGSDPRTRRGIEAESNAGQRVARGTAVDANGRQQVRTDASIHIDRKNRHAVVADNLRFATPVDGSQAATKDYVDDAIDSIVTGSAWQSVSKLPESRTSLGGDGYVVVDQGSTFHYFGALTDLDNLAGVGPNGLQLATGYYWVLRQQVIVGNQSGGTRTVQVRLQQDQGGSIITLTQFSTDIGNGAVRTINLETISSGGDDVYLEVGATSATNAGIVIDSARLHAQLLELRNDPDITGSLPPPLGITASFSAESLTAVAWTDDVAFLQTSVGDADTFTWTFDEWGPTYLDYSGAYGSLVSHRFMDGGTHTVELTASGPSGSDTATVDVVVQDVVETQNLLPVDVDGFNYQLNVTSLTQSAIAAPDGTFTAWDIENTAGTSTILRHQMTLVAGHDWTMSFYVYLPSIDAAYPAFNTGFYSYASRLAQVRILQDGSIGYANFVSGAYTMTTERNVDIELVGNTGWARVSLLVPDWTNAGTSYTAQFSLVETIRNGTVLTVWNPTLRYGDWVSREKNWLPVGLPDYLASNYDTAISDLVTPDGTQSATTWTIGPASSFGYAAYQTAYTGTVLIPVSSYIYYSFYFHTTDYSTSGAYPEIKSWHTIVLSTNTNTEREACQVYLQMQEGSVAIVSVTSQSSHTTYTASDVTLEQVDGRWWKCTLRALDDSGLADRVYVGHAHGQGVVNVGKEMTIWNPRITVGNPADMLDYFVSGPQNLLGDGSDYDPATSGWAAVGSSPPTVTTNTHVAPNGRLEADTIALPAGNFTALHRYSLNGQLPTGVAGASREYQFYIKRDASTPNPQFLFSWFMYNSSYAVIERLQFIMQLNGPTISSLSAVTTGGPGYTVDDIELTNVSNDWVRLRMRLTDYSGTCNGQGFIQHYNYSTSNPADLVLWGSEITTITPKTPV